MTGSDGRRPTGTLVELEWPRGRQPGASRAARCLSEAETRFCHSTDSNSWTAKRQETGLNGMFGWSDKPLQAADFGFWRFRRQSQAEATASTVICRIAQLSEPGRRRPGDSSIAFWRVMWAWPYGPQATAEEAPNRATQGVSRAAAMCRGPVSEPTKRRARCSRAASSSSEVGGARMAEPCDCSTMVFAQACSCSPPQATTQGALHACRR